MVGRRRYDTNHSNVLEHDQIKTLLTEKFPNCPPDENAITMVIQEAKNWAVKNGATGAKYADGVPHEGAMVAFTKYVTESYPMLKFFWCFMRGFL